MERERAILHSDLNCFYASVETVLHPEYRGKALAVCGSTELRHGIVLAKSYPAKYVGVKTGMTNGEAKRLCPDLILVPPHFDYYMKFSALVRKIYARYTDRIEPYGMDECWLDVSGSMGHCGSPMALAQEIARTVKKELGLSVSIGVSFNKVLAKLGSDMKKPDGITELPASNFREIIQDLPAGDLLYVGRATQKKLNNIGVHTIGQLADTPPLVLENLLGVNGRMLWTFANGLDRSPVAHKDASPAVKSVGHGITCSRNLENSEEVWQVMLELCQDIGEKLRGYGFYSGTVQITIKSTDLHTEQFQEPLAYRTSVSRKIARSAYHLFCERYQWKLPVRAVTVTVSDLTPADQEEQLHLFEDYAHREEEERLEKTIDLLRRRFGKRTVSWGVLLAGTKFPYESEHEIIMPGAMLR